MIMIMIMIMMMMMMMMMIEDDGDGAQSEMLLTHSTEAGENGERQIERIEDE